MSPPISNTSQVNVPRADVDQAFCDAEEALDKIIAIVEADKAESLRLIRELDDKSSKEKVSDEQKLNNMTKKV